jgi:hypothetical protein
MMAGEKTLEHELAKVIVEKVENFTLSPAHYAKWSDGSRRRIREDGYRRSGGGPRDLNIFP